MIVYQHRRLDNNEIFYIGIGSTKDRAYNKRKRSGFWKKVSNKYGYKVEIVCTCETREEACQVEQYLIKFYGRRDLGLGPLVNMTDGGDGMIGHKPSEETRAKLSEAMKGKTLSEETKNKISKARKGMPSNRAVKVVDIITGVVYGSIKEASEAIDIKTTTLRAMLTGQNPNKTNLKFI